MLVLLGVLAGACFGLCGVPAAIRCFRVGNANGIPHTTALLIFSGALFMYFYLLVTYGWNVLLFINYAVEILSWGVVLWYHVWPAKTPFITSVDR